MSVEAPLQLHSEQILPEWIDYNGHMNVAFYLLVFDHTTDVFLDFIGLNEDHRQQTISSTFSAELHITYEREVKEGDEVVVATQVLDFDEKRIHFIHQMYHKDEQWLSATNEVMSLYMDMKLRKVATMPRHILARLREIESSHKELSVPAQVGRTIAMKKKKP